MSKLNITFTGPGRCFNPLDFLNGFTQIPSKPGVYIWGYLVTIGGKEVFCPVNVGETGEGANRTLRQRLIEHYSSRHNYNAAFFGFESIMGLETVKEVYEEMRVFRSFNGKQNKLRSLITDHGGLPFKHFLYFQDINFFCGCIPPINCGIQHVSSNVKKRIYGLSVYNKKSRNYNISLDGLVDALRESSEGHDQDYLNRLHKWFDVHQNKFYAIWWEQEDNITRTDVENTVNILLANKLGVFTIAKYAKKFKNYVKYAVVFNGVECDINIPTETINETMTIAKLKNLIL
jgi:hypothetical protein